MKTLTKLLLGAAGIVVLACAVVPPDLYFDFPAPRKLRLPETLPEQITAEELEAQDVYVYREASANGTHHVMLMGEFVPFKIRSKKKAYLAIAALSDLIGIDDVRNDLRYAGGTDGLLLTLIAGHIYMFMQYYQDIPVDGCYITIDSEPNGTPTELMSYFRPDVSLETTEPKLTAAEAEQIAAKYDMNETSRTEESQLVVSFNAENRPVLAWQVFFDPELFPYYVTVDALSGEIAYDSRNEMTEYSEDDASDAET